MDIFSSNNTDQKRTNNSQFVPPCFSHEREKEKSAKGVSAAGERADQRGQGGVLVAPEVAGRLEEDERARFKEASIKNNNVITF